MIHMVEIEQALFELLLKKSKIHIVDQIFIFF